MRIRVKAGPHNYYNCPLLCAGETLPRVAAEGTLVDDEGRRYGCQTWFNEDTAFVSWIEPHLRPGEEKSYEVDLGSCAECSRVSVSELDGSRLAVNIGGSEFTCYNYSEEFPRPFLYPFYSHDGVQVTRNYPMRDDLPGEDKDHKHHRSVWIAYGEVNGTDNWCENEGHAWIRHQSFEEIASGPVFGRIRSRNVWTSHDGVPQMSDVREFTIYNVGSERLMDIKVSFIATHGDVLLKDTKEGGIISVRVASSMDGNKSGTIINSYGGKTEAETWGRPAQWVDYSGSVAGKTYGITLMDHPMSFRHPTRWHVRDYGLFTANPFALKAYDPKREWCGDHKIENGDQIDFLFRLLVHQGDTHKAGVPERYFCFADPPAVTWEA